MKNISALLAGSLISGIMMFVFPEIVLSQAEPTGVSGRILDAETSAPLENAIVFVARTPLGCSSGKEGTFALTGIPPGDYQIVVSRVGYERQTIPIHVTADKPLTLEIQLRPRPVHAGEVEVLGERPEKLPPSLTYQFFPRDTAGDSYCIYGTVSTQPIGILFTDSAFYMYALEPTVVDSEKYIRLWLLYENLSQTRNDFDPVACCKLHMRGKGHFYKGVVPESSTRFNSLKILDDTRSISAKYGGILDAWAALHNQYRKERTRWGELISAEYYGKTYEKTNPEKIPVFSPATLLSVYHSSANEGILQRSTIDPGNSVNGYVYFPFPGLDWKARNSKVFPEAAEFTYELDIQTPNEIRRIVFVPN